MQIQEMLRFLNRDITVIKSYWLGRYNVNRTRSIVVELEDSFAVKVLEKVRRLKNYKDGKVYVRKFLVGEEEDNRRCMMKERWRQITELKVNRADIKIKGGILYVGGKIVKVQPKIEDDTEKERRAREAHTDGGKLKKTGQSEERA